MDLSDLDPTVLGAKSINNPFFIYLQEKERARVLIRNF